MSTLPPPRAKIVALIVEDDPTLADLVTETVESLGHEVVTANSQEDALRDKINGRIGHVFRIGFAYPPEIPRGPSGKYEDFRCELPPA